MESIQPRAALYRAEPSVFLLLTGLAGVALLATVSGCGQTSSALPSESAPVGGDPASISVAVVKPVRTTLRRFVRQPGQIQAFEETPIFSKLAGYVLKWRVDIGDRVKKGEVLAELWVPEMEVEVKQKSALIQQAEAGIKQAKETAAAAEASLKSAEARVKEAESSRLRARAEYLRMKGQYERLERVGSSGVIDKESVEETRYGFERAKAGLEEVEAKISSAQADRDESAAKLGKAKADVIVATAHLEVAKANLDQARALLDYAKLTSPYDGVITRRNVNTGDFVQPATGTRTEPLYIVERRDPVRVFVDVPEADAPWVNKGAKAHVLVQVLSGQAFPGEVARTSYALDRTARTLVAEIDLPNPKDQLRPGMYASATITAEHPDAVTLPASAVVTEGDVTQGYRSHCLLVVDGKVRRTPVEIGARGTDSVEVLRKQVGSQRPGEQAVWESLTGQETVVEGNLSALHEGQAVTVAERGK
jgi:RND family efflux transporter MFP subunit